MTGSKTAGIDRRLLIGGAAAILASAPLGMITPAFGQDTAIERIAIAAFTAAERQLILEYYGAAGVPQVLVIPDGGPGNGHGNGQGRGHGNGNGNGNGRGNGNGGGLPPGLQRQIDSGRGLPPGLAMQIQQRGTLPPGLAAQALPGDLVGALPPRTGDYEIIKVDTTVLLVNAVTRAIVDAIFLQ